MMLICFIPIILFGDIVMLRARISTINCTKEYWLCRQLDMIGFLFVDYWDSTFAISHSPSTDCSIETVGK